MTIWDIEQVLNRANRPVPLTMRFSLVAVAIIWAFGASAVAAAGHSRLVIRFGSECCGTDAAAETRILGIVSGYEERIGRPISRRKLHWGHEGEFNLCFSLAELNELERLRLVAELKSSAASHLVRFDENVPCREGWK